ncbi:MAG: Cu amine oxid [Candidatus Nomurabacteria bacterium]|nr:Cu amine oxid [Candidatus Nomurabacteria bacterium]
MKKQTVITILVVVVVMGIAVLSYVHYKTKNIEIPVSEVPQAPAVSTQSESVTIMEATISEPNYTGTKPVIGGKGVLADAARTYIKNSIDDFAAEADKEVPGLRKQYGNDAPSSHFTIDINAKMIESAATQSIVTDSYLYTGGANGNSSYKVFTATRSGTLLSIHDIVKPDAKDSFVAFIKKRLLTYSPDGATPSVFPDEIKDLTIDSFSDFSFDDKNMTVYFDKYEIGPGALGAVAFPIPLGSIQPYIQLP